MLTTPSDAVARALFPILPYAAFLGMFFAGFDPFRVTYWDVWMARDNPDCASGACKMPLHIPFTVRACSSREAIHLALVDLPFETKKAIFDANDGVPFHMRALGRGRAWSHHVQFDMAGKVLFPRSLTTSSDSATGPGDR